MQTTKNGSVAGASRRSRRAPSYWPALSRFGLLSWFIRLAALACAITACTPPGPRAVLEGKRLLDRGDVTKAIEELQSATRLMPTNAIAFSYLGLALHQAGQPVEAERAYQRALSLDHDLTEVHYDLGCLWMDQSNKLEQAKSELTTYTLRRPNSAEGWLKLGQVQTHLRELTAADRSLEEALRLDPHNAEALTSLGSVRYQRRRTNEAAQLFARALKEQPTYGPALLNSAIVAQQDLNDPRLALQRYREYAALQPPPENLKSVQPLLQQLEQQLNPPPPHETVATNVAVQPAPATNLARVGPAEQPRSPAPSKPASPTNATHVTQQPPRSEPSTNIPKSPTATPVVRAPPPAPTNTPTPENVPVVHLAADPIIKAAEDTVTPSQTEHSSVEPASSTSTSN